MTTTTVYGDTADGFTYGDSATYATSRSTVTGVNFDPNIVFGQALAGIYELAEGLISFDTSSIPDSDVISAVALSMQSSYKGTGVNGTTLQARMSDWGTSVTTADFVAGGSLSGLTLVATIAGSSWSTSGYNDFAADAAFPGQINKTGTTRLLLTSNTSVSGTTPTNDERVIATAADASGTSQDPKLVITHAAPPIAGAVAIHGIGTLTVGSRRIRTAPTAIHGLGTLAPASRRIRTAPTAIHGVGTLAPASRRIRTAADTITGTGTLTVGARRIVTAAATITGTSTLTAGASVLRTAAVLIEGDALVVWRPGDAGDHRGPDRAISERGNVVGWPRRI